MIGDPSGKSDMRNMMTRETIEHNAQRFKEQLSRFITFDDDKAILANNADWLLDLNYVEFLREIGVHFSVNKMLTAECYKQRMERGLTFFEFNYMLMQAYDFLELNRRYGCKLEMGGNDQWSNILAGADLIRRKEQKEAFGLTLTLLTRSDGVKMGKTMAGAVWLDPDKTSPYDFYQYWRNVDDSDVENCLALLTFLPMDEVRRLGSLKDSAINEAKKVLAYEVTKLVHGEEEAEKAKQAAEALFGGGGAMTDVPTVNLTAEQANAKLIDVLTAAKVFSSKREARQMVQQGGLYIGDTAVSDAEMQLSPEMFDADKSLLVRKGKKKYYRLLVD